MVESQKETLASIRSQNATLNANQNLKSQNATSSWGGTRKLPDAFTERGASMLATVIKGEAAARMVCSFVEAF